VPNNADALVEAAKAVSLFLNRPFIRVDLYTDGNRVFFGEATPAPGHQYYGVFRFSANFDAELGELWREGCNRLGWEIPIPETKPPPI
jgi:hypothetical protein